MIEGKQRFLVHHDYGMGGLWWWIWAESAEEIVLTLAEVEVITDLDRPSGVDEDGTLYRWEIGDWPINPPIDLHDPQYAEREITRNEFEEAWRNAILDPDYEED